MCVKQTFAGQDFGRFLADGYCLQLFAANWQGNPVRGLEDVVKSSVARQIVKLWTAIFEIIAPVA